VSQTAIEWTDATWNPVTGCSKVSPGCAHCYAETLTRRFAGTWQVPDLPWTWENAEQNVILRPDRLNQPLRWKRPRMVFVNSMSDLFHEQVPDHFIQDVFAVMSLAHQHTFQVLTKRPERMRDLIASESFQRFVDDAIGERAPGSLWGSWPLRNVWLGTSIENRRYVHRADLLRETPAAVRFISAEPLLGPLIAHPEDLMAPLQASLGIKSKPWLDLTGIDWLIVGGESGPGHRPVHVEWVRDLRDACLLARPEECAGGGYRLVPSAAHAAPAFFFKQWGGATPKAGGRELDGRVWDEMPDRARVPA
jgi:protein gp37